MKNWRKQTLTTIVTALLSTSIQAAVLESHSNIQNTAHQYINQELESNLPEHYEFSITVKDLDRRLRLSACSEPLEAFNAPGSKLTQITSVGVRCNGEQPWSIYVPVKATISTRILVAAAPLQRGKILAASDFRLEKMDIRRLPHAHTDNVNNLVGRELTRYLGENQAVSISMTKKPQLIKRGDTISLSAVLNGIAVHTKAKALANGAAGDRIKVKNESSNRIIEGVVQPDGSVQISL